MSAATLRPEQGLQPSSKNAKGYKLHESATTRHPLTDLFGIALAGADGAQPADRIRASGPILTMNDKAPRAEAVAERAGRSVAVGQRIDDAPFAPAAIAHLRRLWHEAVPIVSSRTAARLQHKRSFTQPWQFS